LKKLWTMRTKNLLILLSAFSLNARAQSGIDSVLAAVERNNKTLQAQSAYYESVNLSFQTGLTPYDPNVGFDYMVGSPVTAGNQVDFTVTQSFDFPTVYGNKKDLSQSQIGQSDYLYRAMRQDILMETKLVCVELVYLNKLNSHLEQRDQYAQRIFNDYNSRLQAGDVSILEFNKAKINLVNAQSELRLNEGAIRALNEKLTQLNGGLPVIFTDTVFADLPDVLPFEELNALYEAADPTMKSLQQQQIIVQQQIDLSKSLWLPTFETGYHYQAILGQTFNGLHVGMTIPLWENKNTTAQKETELVYTQSLIEEHQTSHYSEIKQLYEHYLSLKATYSEYRSLTGSISSVQMLEAAFKGGEISAIEYFGELNTYYTTYATMLQIEMEYYRVVAQLNKYLL
jgi:outer membrane protein, heavy metal efflux system